MWGYVLVLFGARSPIRGGLVCRQGGGQDWGGLVDVEEEAERQRLEGQRNDTVWNTGVNELQEMEVTTSESSWLCHIQASHTRLGLAVAMWKRSLCALNPSIVVVQVLP